MLLAAAAAGAEADAAEEAPAVGEDGLAFRSFVLEHRPVDEAYALIAPYLSQRAEALVKRASGRLEIRDEPANLDQVRTLLASFDVPPRDIRFRILLYKGVRRDGEPPAAPTGSAGGGAGDVAVPPNLRDLVELDVFELLGRAEVVVREGALRRRLFGAGAGFQVELELGDVHREVVELKRLLLLRKVTSADDRARYRKVIEFGEDLELGKRRILYVVDRSHDRRALCLIVTAELSES